MSLTAKRTVPFRRRRPSPSNRLLAACVAWLPLLVVPTIARADVYGYVDAGGTLHLATEKIDKNYTLFMKSGDGPARAKVVRADDAVVAAPDPTLMKTRLFQRLLDHPNIGKYESIIRAASKRHGLDPELVKAVIAVESGFDAGAVSEKGAVGLMQIMPATGERYGVRGDQKKTVDAKLTDPVLNLEIGTRYLSDLRRMFLNRPELVLAAYNAGEGSVIRFRNAIPPFPETQAYVKLVDQFHAFYNPGRHAVTSDDGDRVRVTVPAARRNLPDANTAVRAVPRGPAAVSIVVPSSADERTTWGPETVVQDR